MASQRPEVVCVFFSGYFQVTDRVSSRKLDFDPHLTRCVGGEHDLEVPAGHDTTPDLGTFLRVLPMPDHCWIDYSPRRYGTADLHIDAHGWKSSKVEK